MARSVPNLVARVVGGVLVAAACVYVLTCQPSHPPVEPATPVRPAKTMRVETIGEAVTRSYTGTVKATDLVDLSFRVGGPLVELPVRRGEKIAAGQVVAQIDPRDYRTRLAQITSSLDEARARLKAMRAGEREEVIRRIEAEVTAAKADLENARIELERAEKLLAERVLSQSEYDQARLRHDVAGQKVAAAEQSLEQARRGARAEDIEAQEALVRGLEAQQGEATDAVKDTTLVAPFAGVVARLYVENFQTVRPQQPIVSLQNLDEVDIVADIPESLLAIVSRDAVKTSTATLDALPGRTFDVEFKELEAEADARTQTYAVTVSMPAPEDVNILPGMAATLRLVLDASILGAGDGVSVPAAAVFSRPDGSPAVWRVDPEHLTVHALSVTVGEMTGDRILVREGLSGGDEIVTAGVHLLQEGMKVRRLETDAGARGR